MLINLIGSSFFSCGKVNKIDTSSFVQKNYLRTICIDSTIEEDTDKENQFRNKSLPCPKSIREPASKSNVDNEFNDPNLFKESAQFDFNEKNLDNVQFGKISNMPAVGEHLLNNKILC